MDRRFFLRGSALLGCSAAAHPFLSTVTLAGADGGHPLGNHRLVVIILRGAMDGLDVLQPFGDPMFASYRPTLAGSGATDLDGYFAMHARLGALMPLWQAGELAFAHAVSTPYRDKRSHFDGQDMLEAGTGMDVPIGDARDGWLNRLLQAVPGLRAETAYAVGGEAVPLLAGAAPMRSWTPDTALEMSSQNRLLLEAIYHDDPLFQGASAEAMDLAAGMMMGTEATPVKGNDPARLAEIDVLVDFAASRLVEDTRIAAFSQNGWDTHRGQEAGIGRSLSRLERTILRLKEKLGPVWGTTTVLAMTEFGRTVRENGTKGTDHGTGGLMVMAGGAVRGGKVYGRWPGLAEGDLYDQRDLQPTGDVRAYAAWAMAAAYGLDARVLEGSVFPGLDLGDDPKFML